MHGRSESGPASTTHGSRATLSSPYNQPMNNPLITLHTLGQRIWLDNLSRTLLKDGVLQKLVTEDGLAGVTSNPTIFFKAISESPYYREELAALKKERSLTPER